MKPVKQKLLVFAVTLMLATNLFAQTFTNTGSMITGRYWGAAALLPNGEVLVAGGYNSSSTYLSSAELYNPATGTWTATAPMNYARNNFTATLLPNGEVLVVGG
jgi:Kelch motif